MFVYKERWFKLHANLLFYFKLNEFGAVSDTGPIGVLVLAGSTVRMESIEDQTFVFSVSFCSNATKATTAKYMFRYGTSVSHDIYQNWYAHYSFFISVCKEMNCVCVRHQYWHVWHQYWHVWQQYWLCLCQTSVLTVSVSDISTDMWHQYWHDVSHYWLGSLVTIDICLALNYALICANRL